MKLIIQMPCLNEQDQLPISLSALPRQVAGFDEVEWLVIDDGSTDRTIEVARSLGVDHVVKLTSNKGLAQAFQAGLDACLKLGADVIVNTDADNQYCADDIPALVAPILAGEADMVIGDRNVMAVEHFSFAKKRLQRLGSWVVRQASGTTVPDATSGFRAYNRDAAIGLTVVSRFTYTLESLIQAGKSFVAVDHVVVRTNDKLRESRLFGSTWAYVRRNLVAIFRIYAGYEPLLVFSWLAGLLLLMSAVAWTPFAWDWIVNGDRSGHLQSIVAGGVLLVAALQAFALGVIADLIAAHRTVSQRTLERVRRIELELEIPPSHYLGGSGSQPPSVKASGTPMSRTDIRAQSPADGSGGRPLQP
ncbi:MAG: glycosyltransferase family 2 protein [Actinomycetota bacterium]